MVWLLDASDRPDVTAVPDYLGRLPAGSRVIRTCDDTLPDDWTSPDAIVISGSAAGANDDAGWIRAVSTGLGAALAHDVPILGVCFGHQLLAAVAAGPAAVRRADVPEIGWTSVRRSGSDPMLDVLPEAFACFVSHEDEVVGAPGIVRLAHSDGCDVQAFRVAGRRAWGVQFHLETHPLEAERILRWRAARHPEASLDVGACVGALQDTSGLADAMFTSFLGQAGIHMAPGVEAVEGPARDALREHLARLKHDLGKYVAFQQRWLGQDADPGARRAALESDLIHTRRGPDGSVDALTVWADARPALVGQATLGGAVVDLACDPDIARLDGAMRALAPLVDALRAGQATDHALARGSALALDVSETCRRLVERTRVGG